MQLGAKYKKLWKQYKFSGKDFKSRTFFGGSYCTRRAHRVQRPLSTKYPIHLILRSAKAKGELSFWTKKNAALINELVKKYSAKWGIKVLNRANVGNHLHFLIKVNNRYAYRYFIRGLTGEISLKLNQWSKNKQQMKEGFWDFRPYSRVVIGQQARLTIDDYISVNQLEGLGVTRPQARIILANSS